MDWIFTVFLAFLVGAIVGVIAGSLLGWSRVVEMHDELNDLRAENARLKNVKVIEINDPRPQAADINKNYFTKF